MAVDDKNTKAVIASNSKLDAVNEKLQKINDTMAGVKTSADASADATEDAKNQAASDASEQKEEARASLRERIKEGLANNKAAKAALAGTKAITKGFKSIGGIFSKGLGKLKEVGGKGLTSTFELIKKGALAAGLAAMLFLFDPKYWEPIKKFIMEKIVPGLLFLKDDILPKVVTLVNEDIIPLFKFIFNFLKDKFWMPLKTFFENWFGDIGKLYDSIKASFTKIADGDILGGLMDLFKGIGTFVLSTIDNLATLVYNVIARIFGFDETDSVGGSIMNFFRNIGDTISDFIQGIKDKVSGWYDSTTTFFGDVWTSFKTSMTDLIESIKEFPKMLFDRLKEFLGKSNTGTFIIDTITDIIDSVKAIFSGENVMENLGKLAGSLLDIVMYPVNLAINFIKDIFSSGEEEGAEKTPFKLSEFIFGLVGRVIQGVKDLFQNLMSVDFSKMASDFKNKIFNVGKHIKATIIATGSAVKAGLNPFDGVSAKEAFTAKYNEVMGTDGNAADEVALTGGDLAKNMAATENRTVVIKQGTNPAQRGGTFNIVQDNSNKSSNSNSSNHYSAPVVYNDPLLNDLTGSA